ncbi:MAG: ABC transporter ATP-binding protein [Oscillospiraceae bacterium]|jgi:ABC-2 type transport system ATP-binding protein|nr:ABC transporter ATP-binding protein [Oscillospiraceae bacterium]
MIEIQNLTKRYGSKFAVRDVTFTIKKGEILGFLGRNGAGKTTTMNIVTGYISASEGRVLLDGHDILEEPRLVKRRIGYLPEQPPLYLDMTVDEYLRFACAIKEVKPGAVRAHLSDVCELVKIGDVRGRLIKNLSKGYKQRVGLAQALIGNPEMIILDEPTVGLDPKQILEIRTLIKRLGKDHTVVLSSHILTEVADVCERVVIINKGNIVAQDKLENLTRGIGESFRMTVRIAGSESDAKRVLRGLDGARYVESTGMKEDGAFDFIIESDRQFDIRKQMFNALAKAGLPMIMLRPSDVTLEDIFLKLTGDGEGA